MFESNEIAERKKNTYALNCYFDGLHVIHRLIQSFKAKAVSCDNEKKYTAQSIHILFRIVVILYRSTNYQQGKGISGRLSRV